MPQASIFPEIFGSLDQTSGQSHFSQEARHPSGWWNLRDKNTIGKYLLHYPTPVSKVTGAAGNDDRLDCTSLHTAGQYVLDTSLDCLNKLGLTESIPFSRKRLALILGGPLRVPYNLLGNFGQGANEDAYTTFDTFQIRPFHIQVTTKELDIACICKNHLGN